VEGRSRLEEVAGLAPSELTDPLCGRLLAALRELPTDAWQDDKPDLILLADKAQVSVADVSRHILNSLPLAQSPARTYVAEIKRQAAWRRVREVAEGVRKLPKPTPEILADMRAALELVEAAEAQERPLPLVSAEELISRAEENPPELVEGLLREGTVNLVAGDPGTGKTYLALALGAAVAAGRDFLGRACLRRPVIVVNADGPDDLLGERLRLLGVDGDFRIWPIAADPPLLGSPAYEQLVKRPERPVIVFDCLRRFYRGEENSSTEVAPAMAALRRLAAKGATVLVLHHSSKAEGGSDYRGSSEIGAAVDTAWRLKRLEEGRLELVAVKNRFGPPDLKLPIRLEVTPTAARFLDAKVELAAQRQAEEGEKLEALRDVIAGLEQRLGRPPSQSEVVEAAKGELNIGRHAVLELLGKGEGQPWTVSEGARGARLYAVRDLFTYSPSIGTEQLNRSSGPSGGSALPQSEAEEPAPAEEADIDGLRAGVL
jgi:hypothetical protein